MDFIAAKEYLTPALEVVLISLPQKLAWNHGSENWPDSKKEEIQLVSNQPLRSYLLKILISDPEYEVMVETRDIIQSFAAEKGIFDNRSI